MAIQSIALPESGNVLVTVEPGATIALQFDISTGTIDRVADDLVIVFDDSSVLQLENFFVLPDEDGSLPTLRLPDGTEVASADFLQAINPELDVTAAAPVAQESGTNYADNAGDLANGLDRLGDKGTDYWGSGGISEDPVLSGDRSGSMGMAENFSMPRLSLPPLNSSGASTWDAPKKAPEPVDQPPDPTPQPPTPAPVRYFDERYIITRDSVPLTFGHVLHNDDAWESPKTIIGLEEADGTYHSLAALRAMNGGRGMATEYGWLSVEDDKVVFYSNGTAGAESAEIVTYRARGADGTAYTQNIQIRFADDNNNFVNDEKIDTYYSQNTDEYEMANISLGAGRDRAIVYNTFAAGNGKTLSMGEGDNYIELDSLQKTGVTSGGALDLRAGSGQDTFIMRGEYNSSGNSSISIDTGAGNDSVEVSSAYGSITGGSRMTVNTGEGRDTVFVGGHSLASGRSVADIAVGEGENSVRMDLSAAVASDGSAVSVTGGNENDTISIASQFVAAGNSTASINAGQGDNQVRMEVKGDSYLACDQSSVFIATGDGNDSVTAHGTVSGAVEILAANSSLVDINVGQGRNLIDLAVTDHFAFRNSTVSITTGDESDVIRAGSRILAHEGSRLDIQAGQGENTVELSGTFLAYGHTPDNTLKIHEPDPDAIRSSVSVTTGDANDVITARGEVLAHMYGDINITAGGGDNVITLAAGLADPNAPDPENPVKDVGGFVAYGNSSVGISSEGGADAITITGGMLAHEASTISIDAGDGKNTINLAATDVLVYGYSDDPANPYLGDTIRSLIEVNTGKDDDVITAGSGWTLAERYGQFKIDAGEGHSTISLTTDKGYGISDQYATVSIDTDKIHDLADVITITAIEQNVAEETSNIFIRTYGGKDSVTLSSGGRISSHSSLVDINTGADGASGKDTDNDIVKITAEKDQSVVAWGGKLNVETGADGDEISIVAKQFALAYNDQDYYSKEDGTGAFTDKITVDGGEGADSILLQGRALLQGTGSIVQAFGGGGGDKIDLVADGTASSDAYGMGLSWGGSNTIEVYGDDSSGLTSGDDSITLRSDRGSLLWTEPYLLASAATVHGGGGEDVIHISADKYLSVGKSALTVNGDGGGDSISLTAETLLAADGYVSASEYGSVSVNGGEGNDTIDVSTGGSMVGGGILETINMGTDIHDVVGGGTATFDGGDGDDKITLTSGNATSGYHSLSDGAGSKLMVYGGEGKDTIELTGSSVVSSGGQAAVYGGGGDDEIAVTVTDSLISGGGALWLDGGDGIDTLRLTGSADVLNSILSGTQTSIKNFENVDVNYLGDANTIDVDGAGTIVTANTGALQLNIGAGADSLRLHTAGASVVYSAVFEANGGTGNDSITLESDIDGVWGGGLFTLSTVSINGDGGNDAIAMTSGGVLVFGGSVDVGGGDGLDTITLKAAAGQLGGLVFGGVLNVSGGADADSITLSSDGSLLSANGGVGSLQVDGGTGADKITLENTSVTTLLNSGGTTVKGGDGGDEIVVNSLGSLLSSGGTLEVDGDAGNDTISISAVGSLLVGAGSGLRVDAGADDDLVSLDLSNVTDIGGALLLDGGDGDDTLRLTGTSAMLHSILSGGQVSINNFEHVFLDITDTNGDLSSVPLSLWENVASAGVSITGGGILIPSGYDSLNMGDGNDSLTLHTTGVELISWSGVDVAGGAGGDVIALQSDLDGTALGTGMFAFSTVSIHGDGGADSISLAAHGTLVYGGSVDVAGGDGCDTISIDTAAQLAFGASTLNVHGGADADAISLHSDSYATLAGGIINVNGDDGDDTIDFSVGKALTCGPSAYGPAQIVLHGGDGDDHINISLGSADSPAQAMFFNCDSTDNITTLSIYGDGGNNTVSLDLRHISVLQDHGNDAVINIDGGTGGNNVLQLHGSDSILTDMFSGWLIPAKTSITNFGTLLLDMEDNSRNDRLNINDLLGKVNNGGNINGVTEIFITGDASTDQVTGVTNDITATHYYTGIPQLGEEATAGAGYLIYHYDQDSITLYIQQALGVRM